MPNGKRKERLRRRRIVYFKKFGLVILATAEVTVIGKIV